MSKIRLLEVAGSPYEMGYQHGIAYADDIRAFTEERVHLCSDPEWSGSALPRQQIMALAQASLIKHEEYAPELVEELQGIGDATGLSLPELIIVNGFTDFVDLVYVTGQKSQTPLAYDDCTAFLIPDRLTETGKGFFGQTWDMHDTATPYVILMRGKPKNTPSYMVFTITGCVGMIGMNSAGLSIGINNLSGGDAQVGVSWVFVIRKALMQTNIQDALECITSAELMGAHNYQLFDKFGRGYNIEAMSTQYHVTSLDLDALVHTNHCIHPSTRQVERPRPLESQLSSQARLVRASQLLSKESIGVDDLMELTQDEEAICVQSLHVETCGAAIMRPATGELWAVWGLPTENSFEHFVV